MENTTPTSERKVFMSQVWNSSCAKVSGLVALHQCWKASKFSEVTLPSGRSNALMRVRMFLEVRKRGCCRS